MLPISDNVINNRQQELEGVVLIMGRKALTKKQKVLNLLSKGNAVTWSAMRNKFDLTSPRAMVDQLRTEGHMVYINQTSNGTSYRLGTPTKAIIAAGVNKVFGSNSFASVNTSFSDIVASGIKAVYGKQKFAYSNQ
tara:strand:- start:38 stop:445 length:408 start_codon:yes stop_codon:yes gene_type:complete